MSAAVTTVIYPVTDIAESRRLFAALLGAEPTMDERYYVNFTVNGQDIGLDPHGHRKGLIGPLAYVQVDDIHATGQALLDAGAQPHQDVQDVGDGKLIAAVRDGDGNLLGLLQQSA